MLILSGVLQAATKVPPELTGSWTFLPQKSTGGKTWAPETTLVIKQYGERVYFEYWAHQHLFQGQQFRTDGKMEKLYSSANETAMIEARARKNELVITTHHIMENVVGSQSFSETDRWILSPDGKSLTGKMSDGKVVVFERAKPPAASSTAK